MFRQNWPREVRSGIGKAVVVLLYCSWLFLVFGGLGTITSHEAQFPKSVGWLALGAAAMLMVATVEQWVKALPAFLSYGIFNGLFMIATGHIAGDPTGIVPRSTAAAVTMLAASSVFLASTLSRKLTLLDRIALFCLFPCFLVGLMDQRWTLWAFTGIFCCLATTWAHHQFIRGSEKHGENPGWNPRDSK